MKKRKLADGNGRKARRVYISASDSLQQHPDQRARNTVCEMDYASTKSDKLMLSSNGGATATSRAELYLGSFRAPASSTGCCAIARVHARAPARDVRNVLLESRGQTD